MIYFIRNGETDFDTFKLYAGRADISLNKLGLLQVDKLANDLKNYKFDAVFCSPLTRTNQTLEAILNLRSELQNLVYIDERLTDKSWGILTTTQFTEESYNLFMENPHNFGGESEEDIYNRTLSFLKDIEQYRSKNILIISHDEIFKYFQFCLAGKDIKKDKLINTTINAGEIKKINF